MKQFTMNINSDLLREAKSFALKHDTTVSDLVRSLLSEKLEWKGDVSRVPDYQETQKILRDYSERRVGKRESFDLLGLRVDQYDVFAELMNNSELSWPEPDRLAAIDEGKLVELVIAEAYDEN